MANGYSNGHFAIDFPVEKLADLMLDLRNLPVPERFETPVWDCADSETVSDYGSNPEFDEYVEKIRSAIGECTD